MTPAAARARDRSTLVAVLVALANPVRLAVVRALAELGEANCTELREASGVSCGKSTLSHHMRVLRETGITHTRVVGSNHCVSLRRDDLDARFPGLLDVVTGRVPAGDGPGI